MKKIASYLIILVAGIALGYLFFNKSATDTPSHPQETEVTQMWTCSMHPQINKKQAGDCPICGMELIPADEASDGLNPQQLQLTANAMALANIQTTVVTSTLPDDARLQLSGKIEASEKQLATQTAYWDGRIEQLSVKSTGEQIQKGQLLAYVYAPKLIAAQEELLTAAQTKTSDKQLYQAVRNKLRAWKLSTTQIDAIEKKGAVQENFPIYAQVSGTLTQLEVAEGDYVKKGQTLFSVANLAEVWAVFDVYENQLEQVNEGDSLNISAQAYPNKTYQASVDFVNPVLNKQTRTLQIRATLTNPDQQLKPRMFITASLKSATKNAKQQLVIPESAVLWTGERSVVYVQPEAKQGIFELREVKIGHLQAGTYPVISGLREGERIVTQGAFTVDAAAQLQGKKSMMNQPDTKKKVSKSAEKNVNAFLKQYLNLKNALITADVKASQLAAKNALTPLEQLTNTNEIDIKQHLLKSMAKIEQENDIEKQRQYFVAASEQSIELLQQIEHPNSVYILKCPMANNNKGARWLSQKRTIENPYYGDKMLRCGSVIDSL